MITGKGNTLDFLTQKLPSLPIPEYVRISSEDARAQSIPTLGWDQAIVRSDAPCEDGVGKSFAGMFNSHIATTPEEIPYLVRQTATGYSCQALQKYYDARREWGVDADFEAPKEIPVIIQKYDPGKVQFYITRHPHDDTLHVEFDFRRPESKYGEAHPFRVRTVRELVELVTYYSGTSEYLTSLNEPKAQKQIQEGIENFLAAENELDPEISYQMEASLLPHRVYQFRPFRKREYASFVLEEVIPKSENLIDVPVVFGLTPPEGIPFRHISLGAMMHFDKYNIENYYFDFITKANRHQQAGKLIGASFLDGLARGAAVADDTFSRMVDLRFFERAYSRINSNPSVKWQTHDALRLLEREGYFGILKFTPREYEACDAHYWSDGKSGAIQMFGEPTGDPYF